ncbi:hypothetical protein MRB53_021406 [Persea americana]|uniref:Uncharacterized protein n=1 Tax=Persea americana TaxID=3435 RepID=A0ACC2L3U7_PERAE|nr:hypothetical protein MRB53_021406 [Persea americana]
MVWIINHEENDTLLSRMGAEIYTLLEGTGSWRDVGKVPCSLSFTRDPLGLFVDGELHWWMEKEDMAYSILSMDVEREKFHTVQVPEMGLWACGMMIDWKGCVGIVEYEAARSCTNIWVLKKASTWTTWTIDIGIEWNLSPETHRLVLVNYSINCNLERILPKK